MCQFSREREGSLALHTQLQGRLAFTPQRDILHQHLFSQELKKARFKFTLEDIGLSTQGIKSYLRDVLHPDKHSSKESLAASTDPLLPHTNAINREIPPQAVQDKSFQQHGKSLKRNQIILRRTEVVLSLDLFCFLPLEKHFSLRDPIYHLP